MFIEVTQVGAVEPTSISVRTIESFWPTDDGRCMLRLSCADSDVRCIEAYATIKEKIARAGEVLSDVSIPSDADKICEALDEVAAELRNVREAIQYR